MVVTTRTGVTALVVVGGRAVKLASGGEVAGLSRGSSSDGAEAEEGEDKSSSEHRSEWLDGW